MCEDIYQVYRRIGDIIDLIASDMTITDAIIFMEAWMSKNYMDTESSLELRRQKMDYGICGERNLI